MSYMMQNEQRMLEVIFANRNRAYGAYAIRSAYGNTLFRSVGLMALLITGLFTFAFKMSFHGNNEPPRELGNLPLSDTVVYTLHDPEERKPEQRQDIKQPDQTTASASSASQSGSVQISDADTSHIAFDPNIQSTGTGTSMVATSGSVTGNSTGTMSSGGGGTLEVTEFISDTQPEFEGGLAGLYGFLSSQLKYPEIAREVGMEGTVHVRFVVDKTGKVSRAELLNKKGFGMDEEAIRVVSLIPAFKKPGTKGGLPVNVYYTLPIKFRMK